LQVLLFKHSAQLDLPHSPLKQDCLSVFNWLEPVQVKHSDELQVEQSGPYLTVQVVQTLFIVSKKYLDAMDVHPEQSELVVAPWQSTQF